MSALFFLIRNEASRLKACMKTGPLPIFAQVLSLALLLLGSGCKPGKPTIHEASSEQEVVRLGPQDVGEAISRPLVSGVRILGSVNPSVRLDIKAQVGGLINNLHAHRDLVVTQGQVLATFDDHAILAQLNSAKAQLAAAERENSATELLFKEGAASERAYINSKAAADAARAQLAQVQENVNNTTVRSPIAGVISDRLISAGESAIPGQKLFSVVNSKTLELSAFILPVDVASVKAGMKVIMSFDSFGERQIEGKVSRVDTVADARSRQVGVYVDVPNHSGELVAGVFGSGMILTNGLVSEKFMLVPSTAVRTETGTEVVYGVTNGKLARRAVTTSTRNVEEGFIRILSGLSEGEKIVLNATQQLTNGATVRILSASTP